MTFRELLDVPFALVQANLRSLAVLSVTALVIAELLVVAVTVGVSSLTDGSDAGTAWAAILSTACCAWLMRLVLRGTTVAIGLASIGGAPIGWRAALGSFGTKIGPQLIFQSLYTAVGVSILVLSMPLIITFPFGLAWVAWLRAKRFVVVPVLFAEHTSHRTAVARSKLLAAGAEWQTVGLWFVQRFLLVLLCVPLLGIPWYLSDFSGTHRWQVIVLLTGGALLIIAFGEVVEAATRVVSYVDRRCRREGLDIRIPRLEPR